ncbi:MAG: DUF4340 domain-containing protein [Candidatus Cloacimonetes bacterium]|jgi:hypothetical protein|nr:DUF4340 domain-containing protein [Candidatus Cloacimonadota bacterium]MDD2506172.1 DUF4340 domain-containing protein [Candidatus Cloacimonadota bacterium]MDD4559342.1 DUF4340 domain-containing protein [Candidatus Cloacimonadota bacterium]
MKKSRYILLILLVILITAYFILRSKKPVQRQDDLVNLAAEEINRIEIWNSEERVELILDDGIWKVAKPFLWPADTLMVNNFFREVVQGTFSTTSLSSAKTALERYELDDDTGTHVRLYAGEKREHLIFGNNGNSWDYFRVAGDTLVYQTPSNIVRRFAPNVTNWRDPQAVHYWEHEIREIRSKHRKNEFTLRRDERKWTYKDAENEFEVVPYNFALNKILSILQNFQSYVFESDDEPELIQLFEIPYCTVWITDVQGKTKKLSIAESPKKQYFMMIDDEPKILYELVYDSVYRFTRDPDIFMRH